MQGAKSKSLGCIVGVAGSEDGFISNRTCMFKNGKAALLFIKFDIKKYQLRF